MCFAVSIASEAVFARHVCGGFSSGACKALWAADADGLCPLCGASDTKEHRILHCPATDHIRRPWLPYVTEALSRLPHWLHGPYGTEPEHTEVPRLVFATRTLPALPNPLPWLRPTVDAPVLNLFTDGSCRHPCVPVASVAAYAVVQDVRPPGVSVAAVRAHWLQTGLMPPLLVVVTQGAVPGEQNINRAEFCAVIQACQHAMKLGAPKTVIWTDSAFVVNEWTKARQGSDFHYADLGAELIKVWRTQYELRKVKAHVDLAARHGDEWWQSAGNTQADLAAKAALQAEFPFLLSLVDGTAAEELAQKDLLHLFARFLVALSKEGALLKRHAAGASRREIEATASDPSGATGTEHRCTVVFAPAFATLEGTPSSVAKGLDPCSKLASLVHHCFVGVGMHFTVADIGCGEGRRERGDLH